MYVTQVDGKQFLELRPAISSYSSPLSNGIDPFPIPILPYSPTHWPIMHCNGWHITDLDEVRTYVGHFDNLGTSTFIEEYVRSNVWDEVYYRSFPILFYLGNLIKAKIRGVRLFGKEIYRSSSLAVEAGLDEYYLPLLSIYSDSIL